MLKKTIKYVDYNNEEREEDFYFNLTKTEITEMNLSESGGLVEHIKLIVNSKDSKEIFRIFKMVVLAAFGIKTADGRFEKSEAISNGFLSTAAFDVLIMSFFEDADVASSFMKGVIPAIEEEKKQALKDVNDQSLKNLK